jgi:hypothetical protein
VLISLIANLSNKAPLDSCIRELKQARDDGFERVWMTQMPYDCDLLTVLAAAMHEVSDIKVGSGVVPIHDVLGRDHRLRVVRAHRDRAHLLDNVQLRDDDVEQRDQSDPAEDDGYGKPADEPRNRRSHCVFGDRNSVRSGIGCVFSGRAHADFTKQKARACTPLVTFSSLTSSSMVMRQPR